jgi:hypothetical protein
MICQRYKDSMLEEWDSFAVNCKNSHFMFRRDFMGYHADRFEDHSLLFYCGGRLMGLLPANSSERVLYSHQGLTFGGLLIQRDATTLQVMEMVDALAHHMEACGFKRLVYKPMPHIFHSFLAQEDLFALAQKGAVLISRDLSSALPMRGARAYTKGKKSNLSKSKRIGVEVSETQDFGEFHRLLSNVLYSRHGRQPVHTAEELRLLGGRFPANLQLFGARKNGELIAGALIFLNPPVAHAQYLASSEEGRDCGALDFLLDHLITQQFADQSFFSFGISTEHGGKQLNRGLLESKESFGARAVMHDVYELVC